MEVARKPSLELAERTLPRPLFESIRHVFEQKPFGCALVGGTALSGFYAGHRRSDDMDLFTASEPAFRSAVLAVKSLSAIGVKVGGEAQSRQYYHALATPGTHQFTIDVVLDENLFKVGKFITLENGIAVADLQTLFRMKLATLVSRCAEKDLYDLKWLMGELGRPPVSEWIALGRTVDGGVNAESMLAAVAGTNLRREACHFAIDPKVSEKMVYEEILQFQKELIRDISEFLRKEPTPPLGKLVKKMKKVLR